MLLFEILWNKKTTTSDWTKFFSFQTGMHKKSLEMAKKCSSTSESDLARSEAFCDDPERRGGAEGLEAGHEADEEDELLEEEEELEEEVAIDLSSSSKHQREEVLKPTSSPRRRASSQSDDQSWSWEVSEGSDWSYSGLDWSKHLIGFFWEHTTAISQWGTHCFLSHLYSDEGRDWLIGIAHRNVVPLLV